MKLDKALNFVSSLFFMLSQAGMLPGVFTKWFCAGLATAFGLVLALVIAVKTYERVTGRKLT